MPSMRSLSDQQDLKIQEESMAYIVEGVDDMEAPFNYASRVTDYDHG